MWCQFGLFSFLFFLIKISAWLTNISFNEKNKVLEAVPLVEFMYLVFTCMPCESYCGWLRPLLLYLGSVYWTLVNSRLCWLCLLRLFWFFILSTSREAACMLFYCFPLEFQCAVLIFSSVQFKMVSMRSEKPICAPSHFSEVSSTLPLKWFQCLSDWWWPSLVLSRIV